MDNNNSFLESYKKKTGAQIDDVHTEVAAAETAPPSLRYEQRSGFVKPQRSRSAAKPAEDRKQARYLPVIIIGAVVVLAVIGGLVWFLNRGVMVIDFTGWSVNDAQLWASDSGVNLQIEEQYNDQFDAGKIISQDPAQQTKVGKGGFVHLTVSSGHDLTVTLPLPDLMSMTKEEIDAWSADNFMTKVRITTEFSNDVPVGRVISYEVNDNTVVDMVRRNSPIYVVVSKGSEDQAAALITVPNFREKTIADCYVFASENGITLTVNEQFDNYAPKGSIISQSVKAAETVKKGDDITLIVSKGKQILVPDFSQFSKEKAQSEATQLGIPVAVVEKYSSRDVGKFISQGIEAGSEYQEGDVVELTYSLGNKIVLASYVGQTRDVIEAWAKDLNDKGAAITVKTTYTQSNAPTGQIIFQDKANTVIGNKATINITVSQGKAIFVPDFVAPEGSGYSVAITRDEALTMCEALKIIPVFVEAKSAARLPGEIYAQSIAAGTEVSEGSTITLTYNPADAKIAVPDFTGMTKEQIAAGNYDKTLDITYKVAEEYKDGFVNKVYEQSLRAASSVAAGSAITLTVGPEQAATPATP